jgi:hypothetical protein
MRVFLLLWGTWFLPLHAQQAVPPKVETGYVTSSDGVRLFYARVGTGSKIAILPGRLFTFPDFQRLAKVCLPKISNQHLLNAATQQKARCSRFGWEKFEC